MTTLAEKTNSLAEQKERGRKLRKQVPRSTMADWTPPSDRRPATKILADQETTRVPELVPVSYTHLRAHETVLDLVCRLLLEKKHNNTHTQQNHYLQHN